ncbi:MAG: hypothetical protein M1820_008425 [Bogoriella megaspora]|nr:MAG: hypothetical protein M1820_008425 [Bogoriella megaspora]
MASDLTFGGSDDENAELRKLNTEVLDNPDEYSAWQKLVEAVQQQEGGVTRNSNPQAIAAYRQVFDRFLTKYPLFFGYWKKYAEREFNIAGTEAAEMVYERGVASINNSVDLWVAYCEFKSTTTHDADLIRELFERGASSCGLDYQSHPFWIKYTDFEGRLEARDKVLSILYRMIQIPLPQYQQIFYDFNSLAQSRPVQESLPNDVLAQFLTDLRAQTMQQPRSELEIERELRNLAYNYHSAIYYRNEGAVKKRESFEKQIKRPYFVVDELPEDELVNWRKYLDFEEAEGDYQRTKFLYERCLVVTAHYEEFWLRYARWQYAQPDKLEEVRNIYSRASCLFAPICQPAVRHHYAFFEEIIGSVDIAELIHEAILLEMPNNIETIISWANTRRRHSGIEAAIDLLKKQIDSEATDIHTKGAVVAHLARLVWKITGSPEEARDIFSKNADWYLDSKAFWEQWFSMELELPTSAATEEIQYTRIRKVYDDIIKKSRLSPEACKDITHSYQSYLLERGSSDLIKGDVKVPTEDAGEAGQNHKPAKGLSEKVDKLMEHYMKIDKEFNGPYSVRSLDKTKAAIDVNDQNIPLEDSQSGVDANTYTQYYQQQVQVQAQAQAPATPSKAYK